MPATQSIHESDLVSRVFTAFANDVAANPLVTLRGGDAIDDYRQPPPEDSVSDTYTDAYFETYFWGVGHLDPQSWRHYLPYLIKYAMVHINEASLVVDALLTSLRPPDREPPRLASLTSEQEACVTAFLDALAFGQLSAHQELACQALEEWWAPAPLYRKSRE